MKSTRVLALPLLSALLILASSIGGNAQLIYSLAGNFNTTSDVATNTWSYGVFTSANDPSTYSIPDASLDTTIVPGLDLWFLTSGTDPNIEKNVSSSDIAGEWRAGKVSFGPFDGPAVAQFIVPTTGVYDIAAAFQTEQARGNSGDGTTGFVYFGNTLEFNQSLVDPGGAPFGTVAGYAANNVALTAGEKLYFVVGGGAFTTQVDATITEVPEPSTTALVLIGLGLTALVVRRKPRQDA